MSEEDNQILGYLPIPDIVTRLGLYVTGVGTSVVPPKARYPFQRHPELYDFTWQSGRTLPEFQFVFIAEGEGEFESKLTGLQPVKAGTVIQLFPDIWHRYRPLKSIGWTEYWISFGGELMFKWHERGVFREEYPLATLRHPVDALNLYQRMIDLVSNEAVHSPTLMTSCAMGVIAATLERKKSSVVDEYDSMDMETEEPYDFEKEKADNIVAKARNVIWNHSHQSLSVESIAKQIGTTRRTLERYYRQKSNQTVLQEIVACRIHRAKRLLLETKVPIKHVAHAAGFSSAANFCKVFRRELNLSPGEFRGGRIAKNES